MTFKILTLFPQMVDAVMNESIIGRARKSGVIDIEVIDIRAYTKNKHKNTDDTPFGGGAGMVMLCQPAIDAMKAAMGASFRGKRIYLSPKGETFSQKKAEALAKEESLILLCGHYEGIDQRIIDSVIDEEISVGDYVLTGGELGAMIIVDAVSRLVSGVLGCDESSVDESFSSGLLEYPQYTKPREYESMTVPEVLFGGNQKEIDRWRRGEALKVTYERRPELIKNTPLSKEDRAYLRSLTDNRIVPKVSVKGAFSGEVRGRLWEKLDGRISFVPDADAETVIYTEKPDEMPETADKKVFMPCLPDENSPFCGYAPIAFDGRLNRIIGDEGIEKAVIGGVTEEEFACIAARILPLRKAKPGIADYGKSRRALHAKGGKVPFIAVMYYDGREEKYELNALSDSFIDALVRFITEGTLPVTEAEIADARQIKAAAENQ